MPQGALIVGRYRLVGALGAGGGGRVWRAVDETLNREVALKQLRVPPGQNEQVELARARLLREGRIAARLDHPHVLGIHDVVLTDDDAWLVLEYFPSRSWTELLRQYGPQEPRAAARVAAGVAAGLAAAHAAGIVHRDVTPGNVLIGERGEVKLADFGVSRAVGESVLTQIGMLSATPAYLAPEVAAGADPDPAADVFSLGSTLYTLVEGRPPFGFGDGTFALLRRVASGRSDPPLRAGPLAGPLAEMLDPDPRRRPDAARAATSLAAVAGSGVLPNGRQAGPVQAPRLGRRWVPMATFGAVAVVAALVAALVVLWPRTDEPPVGAAATAALVPVRPIEIRDERTADPCGLMSPGSLGAFGTPTLLPDVGSFSTCAIGIDVAPGFVNVLVELDAFDPTRPAGGPAERLGDIAMVRPEPTAARCERRLVIAETVVIGIDAQALPGSSADLCAIADVAVTTAASALAGRGITDRPASYEAGPLAQTDACGLIDASALAGVPGLAAEQVHPGFGRWSCRWGEPTSSLDRPLVRVEFGRILDIGEADGQVGRTGDKPAMVVPDPSGKACTVQIDQRGYLGSSGNRRQDVAYFATYGPGGVDALCQRATTLAAVAAPKLPAG